MRPPAGLKISAYGPEPLQPVKASPKEESETRALYAALSQLLSVRGSSNPFGEGDYWIVDDSWVPRSHKVCIFDIEFLTPKLVDEVQQLLKERFSQCEVWFQIEVDNPNVKIPLSGIRVFAERIEHDWDRERLRSIFNEKFAW